jgi:hypothetical protein
LAVEFEETNKVHSVLLANFQGSQFVGGGRGEWLGIKGIISLPSLKMTPLIYFEGNSSCLEVSHPDTSKFFSVKNLRFQDGG